MKVSLCDLHAICVSVYPQLSTFESLNQTLRNLVYTPCTKITGAVSSGHNDFVNAHRSMIPTWNETTGFQVLIACAILLPLPRSVALQRENSDSGAESVLCAAVCLTAFQNRNLWLYSPFQGPDRVLSFVILYTIGRTPWTGVQPVARPLPSHRTAQTKRAHRHPCF
jgi:hypothetical protein